MKKTDLLLFFCWLASFCFCQTNLTQFVNPKIGTGGHGHTFPGATVPFGMVQLSPDTRVDGSWDGCSGYHYNDSLLYGFSHTHLSGTGCSDYGDILFMPSNQPKADPKKYAAFFSHSKEQAQAGYYAVELSNQIKAELTASTRCGFHRYTFPKQKTSYVILDLRHRDKLLQGEIQIPDNRHICGMRRSEAWAKDQHIYFYAEFSESFTAFWVNKSKDKSAKQQNDESAVLAFNTQENRTIELKVGISFVSVEGAKLNLEKEIRESSFEQTQQAANKLWNEELAKIRVEGKNETQKKIFYTSFYHCMIQPNISDDVDGKYRGRDNQIHQAVNHHYYTVFSLWDTFRGEHPLLTITDRKRTSDFIKTFLLQYKEGGRLPVWELASNETDCMIGYHSVSVISDAIQKGIRYFDMNLVFDAMKKSSTWNHLGLPALMNKNYIEVEDDHESVSKTLEYAYDDWCIAQVAQLLGRQDDYQYYMRRSQSWKNLFDPVTQHMRPRRNGGWHEPFDAREVNNYFTEGNSWQYTFFVPHDIRGLIESMGGEKSFENKLDRLFTEDTRTTGREQADITGLIGQYAHGNEPSHHMSYLYNYVGAPHKTQALTTKILNELYTESVDGLCGNEDCGQMSAWYVLSAMGIYQVAPGSGFFDITLPLFDKSTIQLENGKTFSIEIMNPELRGREKTRIGNVYMNGVSLHWTKMNYDKIMGGGKMQIQLTEDPLQYWGNFFGDSPPQVLRDYSLLRNAPIIKAGASSFKDSLQVEIINLEKDRFILYKIFDIPEGMSNLKTPLELQVADNSPSFSFQKYNGAFTIRNSQFVLALTAEMGSPLLQTISPGLSYSLARFHKIPNNWKIKIQSRCNPQYTAGGDDGIIDGLNADENWRKGGWQGYQGQNFEAVIDLGEVKSITEYGVNFLQDTRSWILMPKKVEFSWSVDGKNFSRPVSVSNQIADQDLSVQTKNFTFILPGTVQARFVKIRAINYGKLPQWHPGAGGDAFIFIDEISVK